MKNKTITSKLKSVVIRHKRILFTVMSAAVILSVLAASIAVAVRNTDQLQVAALDFDSGSGYDYDPLDDKGYDLNVYTMPDEFDLLNQLAEPPDIPLNITGDMSETGAESQAANSGNVQQSAKPYTPVDSGLPAVYIETSSSGGISSRNTYINGTFEVRVPDGSYYSSVTRTSVKARGRGNSTWKADKKPYRLQFDEKVSILGMSPGKNFVLLANAYDQSHMRNSIAFAAARTLSFEFVPSAIHVDLYVNNKYMGLYTIGDTVKQESDQVGLKTGGVLLELNGVKSGDVLDRDYFHSTICTYVSVRRPKPISSSQMSDITSKLQSADNAVKNLSGYEDKIDMLTLIDFFLLTELLYNFDGSFSRSVFLHKNPDEKFKMSSVWDFDLAMGNYSVDRNRYNQWACVHNSETYFKQPTWINYLIKDPQFQAAVKKRWSQIGNSMYNAALNELANGRARLGNAVKKNNNTKPYQYNIYSSNATANIYSWSGQLDYISTFLSLRKNWLDKEIAAFPDTAPNGKDILPIITTTPPPPTEPPPTTTSTVKSGVTSATSPTVTTPKTTATTAKTTTSATASKTAAPTPQVTAPDTSEINDTSEITDTPDISEVTDSPDTSDTPDSSDTPATESVSESEPPVTSPVPVDTEDVYD
ncbi:MAG: CotH kinase family protein [Oscillospiraceae bacterium]|nr:CotH kinase family protein [Oscillospiraceae bacterium]